jgi:predicted ATP-binding protein involved in virulence
MRLTRVHVTKLVGLFDHEIRLNLDERMTIIHGPNGSGKTIVLRMIAGLISGNYAVFREVPFASFVVESDTGLRLIVEREEAPDPREHKRWGPDIFVGVHEAESAAPRFWYITKESRDFWSGPAEIQILPTNASRGKVESSSNEPDWISKARAHFPVVRLIPTQRLEGIKKKGSSKPTVQMCAEDLVERINKTLADYAARSQELDRNFPTRLLSRAKEEALTAEALRQKLVSLEQKRSDLTRLGFLDPEHEEVLAETSLPAIETKRDVLTVYVNDMESKLAIFDELASKIQLFTQIINSRFSFKRLSIQRDEGLVFESAIGARIEPSLMSSGEQNELILFYVVLFQARKNELLLIDEPEISLHVAWQEKFIEDWGEVLKLSEIDVVIATHSPEIIGEHWDLTVELKGPAELRQG